MTTRRWSPKRRVRSADEPAEFARDVVVAALGEDALGDAEIAREIAVVGRRRERGGQLVHPTRRPPGSQMRVLPKTTIVW